jgi:hypothetical protein
VEEEVSMPAEKEEFKSVVEKQLEDLHRRMVELEELSKHAVEHTPSYDTVHCEARQKHLETMRRLKELDDHGDESWYDVGADVKELIAQLRKAVEEKESTAK